MVAHVSVLEHQKELLLLLDQTITVNLEQKIALVYLHITYNYDPLWDESDCSSGNNCCSNINLPWFQYQTTEDDIEVRICRNEGFDNERVLIDLLELYICSVMITSLRVMILTVLMH